LCGYAVYSSYSRFTFTYIFFSTVLPVKMIYLIANSQKKPENASNKNMRKKGLTNLTHFIPKIDISIYVLFTVYTVQTYYAKHTGQTYNSLRNAPPPPFHALKVQNTYLQFKTLFQIT